MKIALTGPTNVAAAAGITSNKCSPALFATDFLIAQTQVTRYFVANEHASRVKVRGLENA